MKKYRLLPAIFGLFLIAAAACAQNKEKIPVQFGKITAADFDLGKNFDTGAHAVVIADVGKTDFQGNSKGFFTLVFTRSIRVKILDERGFDIATTKILLHNSSLSEFEELSDLKASTYNLEGGKVTETPLDAKSVYTEKVNRDLTQKKFTMPALRAGSIFEVSLKIKTSHLSFLRSWSFQREECPVLYSEYQVLIPPCFHYVTNIQGNADFAVKDVSKVFKTYSIIVQNGTEASDHYSVDGDALQLRLVKKNVPALRNEPFITCRENYLSRISFQLHYIQYSQNSERHSFLSNWQEASEKLLSDEDFGQALDRDNHWMNGEVDPILAGAGDEQEKARRVFRYVRDHFTCNDHEALWTQSPLKDVFHKHMGNVAEINLLLVSMLRHENIAADPVILSTRENGRSDPTYPMITQYNYVVCHAVVAGKEVLLDASYPSNSYGKLPVDCYNGEARIINKERPYLIPLFSDSLREQDMTLVLVVNDDNGKSIGSFHHTFGDVDAHQVRETAMRSGTSGIFRELIAASDAELEITNPALDSLKEPEKPLCEHFDFALKNYGTADLLYFTPVFAETYNKNPFEAADRQMPVELPYRRDNVYVLSMDIPKGYKVDELPKSERLTFNGEEGMFEYLIQSDGARIDLRMHLRLDKVLFEPAEYGSLRDFFTHIVKKQAEQIVLKKG